MITTDRLSAFDRVIAAVPYKGQVLNQLSAWWFERTADVVANHVVAVPDPNVLVARAARRSRSRSSCAATSPASPTSLWRQYAEGARTIYGHHFPDGLAKNTAAARTDRHADHEAAAHGGHDEPITCDEVVTRGLLDADPGSGWRRPPSRCSTAATWGARLG